MPQRRSLNYASFDEIADDVRGLRTNAHEPQRPMVAAQVCNHLDQSLRFAMRPGPFPDDAPEQTGRTEQFKQILVSGRLPDGIPPEQMVPPPDAGDDAIDAFLATLSRYVEFQGRIAPHRLFGARDQVDLRRLARIHCAHHLSHLIPATTSAVATATNG